MAEWGRGYTSKICIARIDTRTWTASTDLIPVDSLSINRNCTDDVPLLVSATLTMSGELSTGWYEVVLIANDTEKVPLGCFLFEVVKRDLDYNSVVVEAKGSSVLRPANSTKIQIGEYAAVGSDGAEVAAQFLKRSVLAPVKVDGGFTVDRNVVFGVGMSCLEAAWLLLDAGGFCMQINGDGEIHIKPKPTEPEIDLTQLNADLLLPGVQNDYDLSQVKNRYIAIENGMSAIAENRSNGAASYEARGFWDDVVDTAPIRVNGESLQAYAERKLEEQAAVTESYSYNREFYPGVMPFSVVSYNDHTLVVTSQTLTCEVGVTVAETAERVLT